MQSALRGSSEAFAVLVRRYRDGLFRYLVLRCASRADAEDALQDTLVNAWRYLESYDARWRFSTWLYRIALRNAARRRSGIPGGAGSRGDRGDRGDPGQPGHPGNSGNPGNRGDPAEIAGGPDPLTDCADRDARENLWLTAKRVLSGDAYAAMWLHYVEDLPLAQVAAALDRSRSWTKVTLMRSRRRLRKEYDDEATKE